MLIVGPESRQLLWALQYGRHRGVVGPKQEISDLVNASIANVQLSVMGAAAATLTASGDAACTLTAPGTTTTTVLTAAGPTTITVAAAGVLSSYAISAAGVLSSYAISAAGSISTSTTSPGEIDGAFIWTETTRRIVSMIH